MKVIIFLLAVIGVSSIPVSAQTSNDNPAAAAALSKLMDPTASEPDRQLALAVSRCDEVRAKVALDNGADANHLGLANETQLMIACQNCKNVKLVELLLKYGAKPDLPDIDGLTALMIASRGSRLEMAKVLLEHGANPNIKSHNPDNIDAKIGGIEGYTALMLACRSSTSEMVHVLLEHGADPKCVGADGKTALDIASERSAPQQREPIVTFLEQKLK